MLSTKIDPQRKTRKKRACTDNEDDYSVSGSQEELISEHKIKPLFIFGDIEAMRDEDLQQQFSAVDCVEKFCHGFKI